MDDTQGAGPAPPIRYRYVLDCPCGARLDGDTEDDIVETSFAHLRERHPDMADEYEREHILFMARKVVRR